MAEPITRDTVMAGRLLNAGHADAKDRFADLWQHSTIRRLSCADRASRRGRERNDGPQMGRVWQVDGVDCASLEEAIERLNVPAVLTEAEAAFLERVPADWTEFRGFLEPMKGEEFGPDQSAYGMVYMLRCKGMVEVERRESEKASFIRRVPAPVEKGEVVCG